MLNVQEEQIKTMLKLMDLNEKWKIKYKLNFF
jgi:hypothetical protein